MGQEYRGLLCLRRKVCCRDLLKFAPTASSGSPALCAIFRAPIPGCWFSGTIEANKDLLPGLTTQLAFTVA
jgi:hypothetical protein